MKIVIIEDEKAAVRNLTSLLNEIKPNGEIVTILDSISSTIEWFSSHPMPELVFMDIHLADGSAFEIFNHINITCSFTNATRPTKNYQHSFLHCLHPFFFDKFIIQNTSYIVNCFQTI